MELLYNNYFDTHNVNIYRLLDHSLNFTNSIKINYKKLLENTDYLIFSEKYNYRPDLVAYEVYGDDLYYIPILIANNVNSVLNFTKDKVGSKIIIPQLKNIMIKDAYGR